MIFSWYRDFWGEGIPDLQPVYKALQQGSFVLVFDSEDREGETDLVMASQFVTPDSIRRMRKDGGGLIFLMTSYAMANKLQLPFLSDVFHQIEDHYPVFKALKPDDIPYDTKSSFSVYINHRDTYTGITDQDRSLTMKSFGDMLEKIQQMSSEEAMTYFGSQFRSPGHVPICVSTEHLLQKRRGHTELIIALLTMAGLYPAGSGCEMMADTGKALSKKDAMRYAKEHGFPFIEGDAIIQEWRQWSK